MARPLRIEYPGAFYHVTSRGNERKEIFKNDRDREKFLSYLESSVERYGAKIHVYCLMSNHYHLMVETGSGNLARIMKHINGSYTTYFNVKRNRSGHLFQGRYKAILVDRDEYAGELSRYTHLNPVRAKMVSKPEDYEWSSYGVYIGKTKAPKWLSEDFILGYFGSGSNSRKNYHQFVNALIAKEYESPLREAVAECILGRDEFVEAIKERYLGEIRPDRDVPARRELKREISFDEVAESAEKVFGRGNGLARKAAIFLIHRYSGKSLKEIGRAYGITESGVSQASGRFSRLLDEDVKLRKQVGRISRQLGLSNV